MADTYRRIKLNEHHWKLTEERVNDSKIFENSHRKLEANQVGFLGEIVLEQFFTNEKIEFVNQTHETTHDYLIKQKYTLDLKTKDRTVIPKINFDNSVPLYNHAHQRPNFYYFISLLRDRNNDSTSISRFTHAFILGGIDIKTLEKVGKIWRAGQVDTDNGTKFWTDCINVSMKELIENKSMLKQFK